jgi:hypothetical protein
MADTPTGETVTPEAPSNEAPAVATPVVNAPDAEVERLKKEADQARMRANQVQNELDKIKADQEAARLKALQDQEEWKTVAEESQAKLDKYEADKADAERKAELTTEANTVLAEFSPEVKKVAETAGMSLTDNTPEAIAEFKTKLTSLAETVKAPTPAGNNPTPPVTGDTNLRSEEVVTAMRYGSKDARKAYIQQSPSIQAVKQELQRQVGVNFSQTQ